MTDTKQAVEMPREIGIWYSNTLPPERHWVKGSSIGTKYIRADLAETVPTVVTVEELWNWFENEQGDIYKLKNRYPNGLKIINNQEGEK